VSDEGALDLPDLGVRRNLRQHVAENLRGLIISGRMAPGELYSAPRLAERFGVSATPVREAMLDLVAEGHVVPVKNKGFRIVELSARELDELAEIRRLVEPPAMGMVATSAAEDPALRPGRSSTRHASGTSLATSTWTPASTSSSWPCTATGPWSRRCARCADAHACSGSRRWRRRTRW
jgi:DNA-binding transcriptional regulator YhcF (GntR family)